MRFGHRLDPRLYSEGKRVRRVYDGTSVKPGGKFLVFLLYAHERVPLFTQTFIDAVQRSTFNLVLVSNAELGDSLKAALLPACRLLIERANVGRDFGAYKDGISIVTKRFPEIARLVLGNDSVAFLPENLDALLRALDGPEDFIGVSEVYDHHYHVASFLLSFGPRVLRSEAFGRFWRNYLPIGTRRWAILKGEGPLTATLLKAGFRPHVLFRLSTLRQHLRSVGDVNDLKPLLPPGIFATISGSAERDLPALIRHLSGRAPPPRPVADAVIQAAMATNQLHGAGFLFKRFMGLPVVKRDICYRQIHPLEQVAAVLDDVEPALRRAILEDFERRGDASRVPLLLLPLYHHGMI